MLRCRSDLYRGMIMGPLRPIWSDRFVGWLRDGLLRLARRPRGCGLVPWVKESTAGGRGARVVAALPICGRGSATLSKPTNGGFGEPVGRPWRLLGGFQWAPRAVLARVCRLDRGEAREASGWACCEVLGVCFGFSRC